MPLWGKTDQANNSPLYAPAQFKIAPNTANRDSLFGNTTADAFTTNETVGVFGISDAEMSGSSRVLSITVTAQGTGFTARPTVSIANSAGTNATATAVGAVVNAAISVAGTGYTNGDVTVAGGTGTSANLTITTNGAGVPASIVVHTQGSYTALPTLANNVVTGGGGTGLKVDLSIGVGNTVTITDPGSGYTAVPAVTFGGTGGTGATGTAALQTSASVQAAHSGWHIRHVGTGGRAGRVFYECLVAGGISGDASDDAVLPE